MDCMFSPKGSLRISAADHRSSLLFTSANKLSTAVFRRSTTTVIRSTVWADLLSGFLSTRGKTCGKAYHNIEWEILSSGWAPHPGTRLAIGKHGPSAAESDVTNWVTKKANSGSLR